MATYDIVIRNGTIVDGDRNPRYRGDIAVKDGVIAKMGSIPAGAGEREIDAAGLIVAPGFIDLHTHYDAQVFWDPYLTTSGWNGVTSVVERRACSRISSASGGSGHARRSSNPALNSADFQSSRLSSGEKTQCAISRPSS